MKIDMRPLLSGDTRALDVDFILAKENPYEKDVSDTLYGVHFESPATVHGVITSDAGYMRMAVDVTLDYTVPCARCLDEVRDSFSLRIERTAVKEGVLENQESLESDEYVIIEDGFLDVDEMLLELLELNFPSKVLCSDDCKGLCPKCGKKIADGPCGCNTKEIDPRLAVLQKILDEMKAEENQENN